MILNKSQWRILERPNSSEVCLLVLLGAQVLKAVWLEVVAPTGDPLSLTASYAATFSAFVGVMLLAAGYFLVRGRWRELRDSLRSLAPLIAVTCLGAVIGILSGNLWGYFIADLGKFCALLLCLALFGFCAGRVRWSVYAVFGAHLWRRAEPERSHGRNDIVGHGREGSDPRTVFQGPEETGSYGNHLAPPC